MKRTRFGRAVSLKLRYLILSYCTRIGTLWFKIAGY